MAETPQPIDAHLVAAGRTPTVSVTPSAEILVLVAEARRAGMCGRRAVVAVPDAQWRHPICAVLTGHLGYHRAPSGDLWAQDAAELEATGRRLLAERDQARAEHDAAVGQASRLARDLALTRSAVRIREAQLRDAGVDMPESIPAAEARDALTRDVAELRQAIRQALDEILPHDLGTDILADVLARTDPARADP